MRAIVGIPLSLGGELRNKTVVFYTDNANCRDALVRGYTATKVADSLVQICWAQINRIGIFAWFELMSSDSNPSDAPTRFASPPFPIRKRTNFGVPESLTTLVYSDLGIKRSTFPHMKFSGSDANPHLWAHHSCICSQSLRNVGNPQ